MILSLLTLDISSPSVCQCLYNCQDMHRTIMKAFDSGRSEAKVLYRIEHSSRTIRIYVQSQQEPHWHNIEAYGFRCERTQDISRLLSSFHAGQVLHFTVHAFPSKKMTTEGKNSRRVIIRGSDAQIGWLSRQGEKYGFDILEAHIVGKGYRLFGKRENGEFYINGIPFEGVLQVKNADLFAKGFTEGIGAEKAYGLGMLMVSKTK